MRGKTECKDDTKYIKFFSEFKDGIKLLFSRSRDSVFGVDNVW